MPLCKIDYDRSEIREYQNEADKGHSYLHLMFIPKSMNLVEQSFMGNMSEYPLNIFPKRDSEMNIDEAFENALLDAFEKKQLGDTMIDRVEVEIPPTLMRYSSGANQDKIIQENGVDKVYTTLQIICVMKEKADKSGWEPSIPMNRLKAQAARIREQRINSGSWIDATTTDDNHEAETANIIAPDEEEVAPRQQPQQRQPSRQQPQRR